MLENRKKVVGGWLSYKGGHSWMMVANGWLLRGNIVREVGKAKTSMGDLHKSPMRNVFYIVKYT